MNKKRLSVVMAGAMLASAVAPVMAAEVQKSEVSANELGLLQEEVRTLVESARFADVAENGTLANESIYTVYFNKNKQENLTADAPTQTWQDAFNSLRVGDVVRVYTKGAKEIDGKYYHAETKVDVPRYTKDDLKDLPRVLSANGLVGENKVIESVTYDETLGETVIVYNDDTNVPGLESSKSVSIAEGDQKIKLTTTGVVVYKGVDGKEYFATAEVPTPETFAGFVLDNTKVANPVPYATELVKEYVITPGGYNFDVSDLYDGLFLTDKGNEFFEMLKDAVAADRNVKVVIEDRNGNHYTVSNSQNESAIKSAEKNIYDSIKSYKDVYRFEVKLAAKGDLKEETYVISGKDKKEVARLASWMLKPQARVDKFEGSNRYETAVLLAKEYAGLNGPKVTNNNHSNSKEIKDIVLVNGNALVDGLAAAPLASSLAGTNEKVPTLLTEADHLPKETVKFLKELMADHLVGNNKSATIHLVGGESVLNKSLERELRSLGFGIVRYDGENREETSLAVAKKVNELNRTNNEAFVVGGTGEADAMSISAVAADQKTPIIVSNVHGLSEDAIYELKGMDATIIGGKSVVSSEDEKALREEAKSVNRIYGNNRKATNAKVIEKYYNEAGFANSVGNAENVIVAKDGIRNKGELIDALAAANMAAVKKAPIVLATDSLSKEQTSAINSYANDAYGLFQVGGQVNRDVVKSIARMLNLTNR